jgi:pyruvate dehydrogenase E2 component (dihydrolipoamide acetyltransferase)
MAEFRMPSLGPDMTSGTLVEWLIKAGDHVTRGDVVAVVETDKGTIDVEIFDSGLVSQLVVPNGSTVPVGAVLALLNGEKAPEFAREPEIAAPEVPAPSEAAAAPAGMMPLAPRARIHASPLARRRAAELGIALTKVRGSRPGGAITVADVEQAAALAKARIPEAAPAAPSKRSPEEQRAAMRAAIAALPGNRDRHETVARLARDDEPEASGFRATPCFGVTPEGGRARCP